MDCELHPHPHTDDKDDRWDSTQADLGQTHETKQFHHSYSQHNNLQRKKTETVNYLNTNSQSNMPLNTEGEICRSAIRNEW